MAFASLKKAWGKTKDSATVGFNKAMDATGKKKIEDDPDFSALSQALNAIETKSASITSALLSLGKHYVKAAEKFTIAADQLVQLIPEEHYDKFQNARKVHSQLGHIQQFQTTFGTYIIGNELVKPLQALSNDIKNLKKVEEKRKKHLILVQTAEKDNEKKPSADLQAKIESNKQQYDSFHQEYMTKGAEIKNNAGDVFEAVYDAFQFYVIELSNVTKEQLVDKFTSFPYEELKSKHPSVTAPPPVSAATTNSK
jgi:uncharacterized protein YeeX (DUF496 family)